MNQLDFSFSGSRHRGSLGTQSAVPWGRCLRFLLWVLSAGCPVLSYPEKRTGRGISHVRRESHCRWVSDQENISGGLNASRFGHIPSADNACRGVSNHSEPQTGWGRWLFLPPGGWWPGSLLPCPGLGQKRLAQRWSLVDRFYRPIKEEKLQTLPFS